MCSLHIKKLNDEMIDTSAKPLGITQPTTKKLITDKEYQKVKCRNGPNQKCVFVWESLQRMCKVLLSNANIQLVASAPTVSMLIRVFSNMKALTTGFTSKRRNFLIVIL